MVTHALPITLVGGIVVMAGFIGPGPAGPGPRVFAAGDSAAIHSTWAALDSAWNARDPVRFSGFFAHDASLEFVERGTSLSRRTVIEQHFTRQFRDQRPDLRHSTAIRRIHDLTPDIAGIDGEVTILGEGGTGSVSQVLRRFAITGVMVRTAEGWRIRLLRVYLLASEASRQSSGSG